MGDTSLEMSFVGEDGGYDVDDDDEYEYLALPEVDEEYLDDKVDTTCDHVLNKVPFTKIHAAPIPFESTKRRCFMPGQKVHVKIIDIEHTETGLFNPNLGDAVDILLYGRWYVIELNHGEYTWTIRRRYKHFRVLHESLMLFKAKVKVAVVPTKTMKARRKSFAVRKHNLPKFPKTPEPLVRNDNIDERKQQLENYLQNILRFPQFRNHLETLRFLEVSHLSFVHGLGDKWREGMMRKRAGGRRIKLKMCGCCPTCHCTATWNSRWLILKDTCLAYISPKTGAIGDVMLMDRDFSVQHGILQTGVSHGLVISNLSRHLLMKCETHRQAEEWYEDIQKAIKEKGEDFTQSNRYHSFAPTRQNSTVNWFVDGANYMAAVADAIEGAKEEIFITDWWLSPELYLKRPITEEQTWRLDLLLQRKADQGVCIYILVFKEMEVALGLNSYYTKQTLVRLHPNIRVLRHPDGITLWSHHEKLVCIDQRVAFLGGIDLCYGRWDTKSHMLTDLGSLMNLAGTEADPLAAISEESETSDDDNAKFNSSNSTGDLTANDTSVFIHRNDSGVEVLNDSHSSSGELNSSAESRMRLTGGLDLNSNNNGNGEDARLKQSQLAQREHELSQRGAVQGQIPRNGAVLDYGADHETEESDIDTEPEDNQHYGHKTQSADTPPVYRIKPDLNGSYDNPELDQMMIDEKTPNLDHQRRSLKVGSGPHGYVGDDESYGKKLSGQGQLNLHDNQYRLHEDDSDSELPQSNLSGQGHLGLHTSADNYVIGKGGKHRGLNGTEIMNGPNESDLAVVVAGDGGYWKISKNKVSGSKYTSEPNDDKSCDNEPELSNKTKSSLQKSLDSKSIDKTGENPIPRIEITDTTREARGRNKPILRHMSRQKGFDDGGGVDSPSEDDHTIQSLLQSVDTKPDQQREIEEQMMIMKLLHQEEEEKKTIQKLLHGGNGVDPSPGAEIKPQAPVILRTTPQTTPGPVSNKITTPKSDVKRPPERPPARPSERPPTSGHHKVTVKQDSIASQSSSTSETSDLGLDGVFEAGEGSDPTSFKAYLNDMKTQPQPQEDSSGLGMTEKEFTDRNSNKVSGMNTPPRTRKMFRPPKLSRALLHFGKGSKTIDAMDEDTAASLAEPGVCLPKPTPEEIRKAKHPAPSTSAHGAKDEPPVPQPKPTTPKSRRKGRRYDIKERFRKNKMMSIDVTDDAFAHPWKDSLQGGPQKILNPHEVLEEEGLEGEVKLWIGKDYVNFIFKDFVDLDKPFTDMVDRRQTPRMPWHDIGCMVAGKAARDVARHFIQRWNYTKLSKKRGNDDYPMILPKTYSKVSLPQWVVNESYCADCQILRSSCEWSAGIQHIECSIHEAYVDMILKAKHFIYIENQFFVTVMNHDVVENQISRALYERILAAHKKKEVFRVYVVMPLLPAFEGSLGTATGTSIQAIIHWNYVSMCRGGRSLLENLAKEMTDPFEYISFYGLRTHDKLPDKLASELVYVHSKMMIVDDRSVIIGSANINDRSMLGKRDSELAIIIEDTRNLVKTTFNQEEVEVGRFASDLRKNCFREHLGLKDEDDPAIDLSDPVSTVFYKGVWLKQASVNTSIFERVFHCIPTDNVQTYHQLKKYEKEVPMATTNPEKAEKLLKKIQGQLVLMPLLFLAKENLGNLAGTKEGLMPKIIYT